MKTSDLVKEYRTEAIDAYKTWLRNSQESVNYALGYQWKKADKDKIESEGRPALTYNKIRPIIRLVSGYQRQNRQDIKVVGVEGGDDFIAQVMTLLIKNIMTRNYGEYKVSQMFQDGLMSSRGWIEPSISYEDDPLNGKILLHNNPFYEMFPDPTTKDYAGDEGDYLLKIFKITRSRLVNLFPKKEKKIKTLTSESSMIEGDTVTKENPETGYYAYQEADVQFDEGLGKRSANRQSLTLVECEYKKYEEKMLLADLISGEISDVTGKLSLKDAQDMSDRIPALALIKQRVGIPWVATMCGDTMLEDSISPNYPYIKSFSHIPYIAAFTPIGVTPEKMFQDLVGALKDPQNEINKRQSQILNAINSSIWKGDKDALTPEEWKDLERTGASPRLTLKLKPGAKLDRVELMHKAQFLMSLAQQGTDVLKELSGINPDLWAAENKQASGRALAIRQQQGIMVVQDVFDNLRYSRHILGRKLIGVILANYTPERVVRVVGEKFFLENGYDDPKGTSEMILNEFDMREYDLAMDEAQVSPVMRMAVAEELIKMREAGIIPPGVADDLIIDGTDLPNKEILKERIAQFMSQAAPPA